VHKYVNRDYPIPGGNKIFGSYKKKKNEWKIKMGKMKTSAKQTAAAGAAT